MVRRIEDVILNVPQTEALELNVRQLQNRLDRQLQKMRDLELHYAVASAPVQRRLAELEAASKKTSSELNQQMEELQTDFVVEKKRSKSLEQVKLKDE